MPNTARMTLESSHGARSALARRFRSARMRAPQFGRRLLPPLPEKDANERRGMQITAKDVRQFLMAYTACFVVVMGMIA